MLTVEEITSWTVDQLLTELLGLLSPQEVFDERIVEGGWTTASVTRVEGPTRTVLWSGTEPDRRLLLLNAFGWVWLRGQKTKHPVWKPRGPEGARPAPRPHPAVPDPPDLDPEEVTRLVYWKKPPTR
jgi:hypothetical protein